MKTTSEILALRLRLALAEACCDSCADAAKKGTKARCQSKQMKVKEDPGQVAAPRDEIEVRKEQAEKSSTHPFIKRCVAAITKDNPEVERGELSRAFAICTAQMQKLPKAAKAKAKEGVPKERMADYERALSQAREATKK